MTRRMPPMIGLVALLALIAVTASAQPRGHSPDRRGDDNPFRNTLARDGRNRHEAALREAAAVYRRAIVDAHRGYYRELQDALAAARGNRNDDERGKIQAEMERVRADIDRLENEDDQVSGRTRAYEIFANRDWQRVRDVQRGDVIVIRAEGEWTFSRRAGAKPIGPEGAGNGVGKLMGRIGTSEFDIGSSRRINVEEDGALEMRANDNEFADNAGKLSVTVTVRAGD